MLSATARSSPDAEVIRTPRSPTVKVTPKSPTCASAASSGRGSDVVPAGATPAARRPSASGWLGSAVIPITTSRSGRYSAHRSSAGRPPSFQEFGRADNLPPSWLARGPATETQAFGPGDPPTPLSPSACGGAIAVGAGSVVTGTVVIGTGRTALAWR